MVEIMGRGSINTLRSAGLDFYALIILYMIYMIYMFYAENMPDWTPPTPRHLRLRRIYCTPIS